MMRELHEAGLGYRAIGRKFEVSRQTVCSIVKYRTRAVLPDCIDD